MEDHLLTFKHRIISLACPPTYITKDMFSNKTRGGGRNGPDELQGCYSTDGIVDVRGLGPNQEVFAMNTCKQRRVDKMV